LRLLFSSSLIFSSLGSKEEEENKGRGVFSSLGSKEEEENKGRGVFSSLRSKEEEENMKGLGIVWFNFFEQITLDPLFSSSLVFSSLGSKEEKNTGRG
jgi:hypothetical protein